LHEKTREQQRFTILEVAGRLIGMS